MQDAGDNIVFRNGRHEVCYPRIAIEKHSNIELPFTYNTVVYDTDTNKYCEQYTLNELPKDKAVNCLLETYLAPGTYAGKKSLFQELNKVLLSEYEDKLANGKSVLSLLLNDNTNLQKNYKDFYQKCTGRSFDKYAEEEQHGVEKYVNELEVGIKYLKENSDSFKIPLIIHNKHTSSNCEYIGSNYEYIGGDYDNATELSGLPAGDNS